MKVTSILLTPFTSDSRVLKESLSLAKTGHSVTIVCLWEEGLREREMLSESVSIHRLRLLTKRFGKNLLIQAVKYVEFLLSAARQYSDSDILHCNDLAALPVGVFIKLFRNRAAKIVYDCHELETDTKMFHGLRKLLAKAAERILIRSADVILTVNLSIARWYAEQYSIPLPRVVMNCPPYEAVGAAAGGLRLQLGIPEGLRLFLHIGGLSDGRGIPQILEAFRRLDPRRYAVAFMGSGRFAQDIRRYAAACSNIFLCEPVPSDQVVRTVASADFGLSLFENTCLNHYYATPNKLFECIMALLPLIVSNVYEQRRIVTENRIGLVLEEDSVAELCRAVAATEALDIRGIKEREMQLARRYCWEEQEKELLDAYSGVSGAGR